VGNIVNALNWFSWLLSAFVTEEFGIAPGCHFLILGIGTRKSANTLIPRLPRIDQIGHVISIPTTIF
jgi:hypothetical protein